MPPHAFPSALKNVQHLAPLRLPCLQVFYYPSHARYERCALRILEALAAAGVRPAVYRCVAPPRFLRSEDGAEREVLDPFHEDPLYQRLKPW